MSCTSGRRARTASIPTSRCKTSSAVHPSVGKGRHAPALRLRTILPIIRDVILGLAPRTDCDPTKSGGCRCSCLLVQYRKWWRVEGRVGQQLWLLIAETRCLQTFVPVRRAQLATIGVKLRFFRYGPPRNPLGRLCRCAAVRSVCSQVSDKTPTSVHIPPQQHTDHVFAERH